MTCPCLDTEGAAAALRGGGVLLLATDTLPGLHAVAANPEAVRRIQDLKGRSAGKPMLVLASSLKQALTLTDALVPEQIALCRRCWPGPFTLILPAGSDLGPGVFGPGPTVAVRVPALLALKDLIEAVGEPLVSTSANREGDPPAEDLAAAAEGFGEDVAGCWDHDSYATAGPAIASALVDLTVWPPEVRRPGPLPLPGVGSGPA